MLTLGECLERWRETAAKSGKAPTAGPPALIEATVQEEQTLNEGVGKQKSWTTQLVPMAVPKESKHETERVEKMKALLGLVGEASRVFYIRKAGDNESHNVCIGRAKRNDVLLHHSTVSSVHARIEYVGEGLHLTDLKSSNGTWVNKKRLGSESVPLVSGDCVRFGARVFYYLSGERMAQLLAILSEGAVTE
jgi:hypothetical protein